MAISKSAAGPLWTWESQIWTLCSSFPSEGMWEKSTKKKALELRRKCHAERGKKKETECAQNHIRAVFPHGASGCGDSSNWFITQMLQVQPTGSFPRVASHHIEGAIVVSPLFSTALRKKQVCLYNCKVLYVARFLSWTEIGCSRELPNF